MTKALGGRPKITAKQLRDDLRLPAGEEPWTIRCLRSLQSGQSFKFYSGSMCDAENDETPLTGALLHQIFACVRKLEQQGRIAVTRVKISGRDDDPTQRLAQYAYTATGI
jgi:hypothetical protein